MPLETPLLSAMPLLRRHARSLERLGLVTLADVLAHHPFRYEDYSRTLPLSAVVPGEEATVRVRLEQIRNRRSFGGPRRLMTEAVVADGSGKAKVLWFGQHFLVKTHKPGSDVFLAGKARRTAYGLQFLSPTIEAVRAEQTHTGRIVPVYPTAGTLSVKHLRLAAKAALPAAAALTEWLPDAVRSRFSLPDIASATRAVHFPSDQRTLDAALERFAVEDMFLRVLVSERARRDLTSASAPPVPFPEADIKAFVAGLPFPLTDGQRRAAWEAIQDLGRPRPMNRLVNGDVGSGKTAVAAIAARAVAAAGAQAAVLVPTEVLAEQHLRTLASMFAGTDVVLALLAAGSQRLMRRGEDLPLPGSARVRQEAVRDAVRSGTASLVVGTHALIEGDVAFADLRLAVVDEQHRFGVRQRQALRKKRADGALPHLLSLTATPIPRTLTLSLFGDLDVSVLAARPAGRGPVATRLLLGETAAADAALAACVAQGHQAFVVCPSIAGRADAAAEAAIDEHRRLVGALPEARVLLLHGKMKSVEKRTVMRAMAAGEGDVLVATTVIEVGIDLPRAALIVVRSADRFGLAQLHQLRGRVGRGSAPGTCLLLTDNETPAAAARLQALVDSSDGFALAETDLALRGPGELWGTAQSGMQGVWSPALLDARRIAALQESCRELLDIDASLDAHPALRGRLARFEDVVHPE